jgi:tripartite-type tricarboxylate transporter receptor subunit TctC
MKLARRKFLHFAAGTAALFGLFVGIPPETAKAQVNRTIKIVVPFAPGGAFDILARLLAEQTGRTQSLTIVVENRPGAGTVIATEATARAAPDGRTILLVGNSFVINSHLRKLTYDPLTSFIPLCNLVDNPLIIVVNATSPYHTLTELLDAARAKPSELTFASAGPATTNHIAIESLKRTAQVNMTYVPFAGTGPVVNALLGQHVTAALLDYSGAAENIKAGKLRALANTSRLRLGQAPDLPTVAESGLQGYVQENWIGAVVPAKTPQEAVTQLSDHLSTAVQTPEIKSKLFIQGYVPIGACGVDFATLLRKQYDDLGRIIRDANIKGE